MNEIIGKSVLILGYGAEGQSVRRWLKKFHPDLKIGIADSSQMSLRGAKRRGNPNEIATLRPPVGGLARNDESFTGYDTIVKSPGIPPNLPALTTAKAAGRHITSATNIFFSVCPGKIIAVTGTKGKSTTASLIKAILSTAYLDVRLVGNIGNPALDYPSISGEAYLIANDLETSVLILDNPLIGQIYDLVANSLETGSSVLGHPSMIGENIFVAVNLITDNPELENSTLTQNHNIIASNVATNNVDLENSLIGQIHNLTVLSLKNPGK